MYQACGLAVTDLADINHASRRNILSARAPCRQPIELATESLKPRW